MIKFKEKISATIILGIIFPICFVTLPFIIIVFANSSNLKLLPFVLGWCAFCVLVAIYRLQLMSNIKLDDKVIFVPNRGYHKSINDIRGHVKILNGRLVIPYNEISEIKIQNRTIYLSYNALSNNVVLHPIDVDEFVFALKENLTKLGLNIPIHSKYPKETLLEFKNELLTNTPTLICFSIFLLLPNLAGLFSFITGRGNIVGTCIFMFFTLLTTITFYISIFQFRATIILSDKELIQANHQGDIDLGSCKIAYEDIIKITKTKWRVDIETNQEGTVSFVSNPEKLDVFYSKLQNKVSNLKIK